MSRYRGPSEKFQRRLGYSISETGKELKNVLMHWSTWAERSKLSDYGLRASRKTKFVTPMVLVKNSF